MKITLNPNAVNDGSNKITMNILITLSNAGDKHTVKALSGLEKFLSSYLRATKADWRVKSFYSPKYNTPKEKVEAVSAPKIVDKSKDVELLTTAQLCEWLNISDRKIRHLRQQGKLPFIKKGQNVFFERKAVVNAINLNNKSVATK